MQAKGSNPDIIFYFQNALHINKYKSLGFFILLTDLDEEQYKNELQYKDIFPKQSTL